jgi:hypothetical protein
VLQRNGFRIGQIPIALPNRTYGHSKVAFSEIYKSVRLLATTKLKAMRLRWCGHQRRNGACAVKSAVRGLIRCAPAGSTG